MSTQNRDPWFDGKGFDLHENVLQSSTQRLNDLSPDNQFTREHWLEQRKLIFKLLEQFESKLNDSDHQALTKILIEYETLLRVTDEMKDDAPWQAELF
jgi:hypothetical protein